MNVHNNKDASSSSNMHSVVYSLEDLLDFAYECVQDGYEDIHQMTLEEISIKIIHSSTHSNKTPLLPKAHFSHRNDKEHHSIYMVCYSPTMKFQALLEALENFIEEFRDRNFEFASSSNSISSPSSSMLPKKHILFWIDIFSILTSHVQNFNQVCQQVTTMCENKVVVISPWNHPEIFHNIWTLYQLFMASTVEKAWDVGMTSVEKGKFVNAIRKNSLRIKDELVDEVYFPQKDDINEHSIDTKKTIFAADINIEQLFGFDYSLVDHLVTRNVSYGIKKWIAETLQCNFPPKVSQALKLLPTFRKFAPLDGGNSNNEIFRDDKIETFLIDCIEEETHVLLDTNDFVGSSFLVSFLSNLGDLYVLQRRWTDAEAVFLRILELQKQELGSYHRATIDTMYRLAEIFGNTCKYLMAELFFKSYLDGTKKSDFATPRDILLATQQVGNFYYSLSLYDKAQPLYEAWHSQAVLLHGQFHHITLNASCMLAHVYVQLREFHEAMKLSKECVEIAKQLFHQGHDSIKQYQDFHQIVHYYSTHDVEIPKLNQESIEIGQGISIAVPILEIDFMETINLVENVKSKHHSTTCVIC